LRALVLPVSRAEKKEKENSLYLSLDRRKELFLRKNLGVFEKKRCFLCFWATQKQRKFPNPLKNLTPGVKFSFSLRAKKTRPRGSNFVPLREKKSARLPLDPLELLPRLGLPRLLALDLAVVLS